MHRKVAEQDALPTSQIDLLGNGELRAALWQNGISFPSQIPLFHHLERGRMQVRMAQLYFLRGWTFAQIALRYGLTLGQREPDRQRLAPARRARRVYSPNQWRVISG